MQKTLIATAVAAVAFIGAVEVANAGVAGTNLSGLRNSSAMQLTEEAGWRQHRRNKHKVCYWRHGHKHCYWRWR